MKYPRVMIDATVGNGYDTLFMAEWGGPDARVLGIDLQAEALESAHHRLKEAGLENRVKLVQGNHADLAAYVPEDWVATVDLIMFNLGYLPGGDKTMTTCESSTLAALVAARSILRPGGYLSVIAYQGHPGGAEEAEAVSRWFDHREQQGDQIWRGSLPPERSLPPRPIGLIAAGSLLDVEINQG